jgi:hypothetical protein
MASGAEPQPFEGERRLTDDELGILQQWIAEGSPEGITSDLSAAPRWPEGWFLGEPDLVVRMPQPYTVRSEGRDDYRNFVLPIPTTERRYVRAVELRPGNARIVHHCFMFIDETGQSRSLDGKEAQLGAPYGTQMPEGQFLSYQPGRVPAMAPEGLAWALKGQLHRSTNASEADWKKRRRCRPRWASISQTERRPTPVQSWLDFVHHRDPLRANRITMVTDSFVLPVDAAVPRSCLMRTICSGK